MAAFKFTGPISPAMAEALRLIGERIGNETVQERISTILTDVAAVDTVVNANSNALTSGTFGLATIKATVDGIQTDLSNGTDGLGALKAILDSVLEDTGTTLPATLSTLSGDVATVDTVVDSILSALQDGTTGLAAIKTKANDIEADTQDLQSKVGTPAGASVSADIAAVKSQTAAIETDTQDIQTKIGAPAGASVSADVAAVKADTASIKSTVENGTYGLSALKGEIDANEAKLDIIDTVVDGIQTDLDNATDGLGALKTLIDTVDTVVDGIQTDLSNGTDGLGAIKTAVDSTYSRIGAPVGATISADIAALKAVADNINNSTRCAASIASQLEIPEAGKSVYKVTANLFDSAGLPQEADSDAMYYRLTKADGSTLTGVYYSDAAATTAITAEASGDWTGWYVMDTTPVGRASSFVGIAAGAVQQGLTLEVGYKLSTHTVVVTRSTQTVDYLQIGGAAGVTADAVWDELTADHTTSATFGKAIADVLADTNELQTDWTNGGRLDLIIDELTANVDTVEAKIDIIDSNLDTVKGDLDNGGRLDLIFDAILADTAELQTDWANGGRLDLLLDAVLEDTGTTLPGTLATMDGKLDSILEDTGTTLPGTLSTIEGKIDTIDGLLDVPSADAAGNSTVRDVVGNKTDTVAAGSLVGLVKKVQSTLDNEQGGGTAYLATKATSALAQGASATLALTTADGFDCFNANLGTLRITKGGGAASTKYTVKMFADVAKTIQIFGGEQTDGSNTYISLDNQIYVNRDSTVAKKIYVEITNDTDAGTTSFSVELIGIKLADVLA